MSDIVSPLLEWLNANPEWAGFATFAISAAESVAIIGTIVPGTITMTAIGALAGAGIIPLWGTIIWAILGAILGDGISYWIGHYFKSRLRNMWPFKNNPNILIKGEAFVHKYGVMSVFIGRFVGPVRALVPLVAGMLGMKPLRFTIANIASAIGWAPAYMLPGILLGAASLELPPDIAVHVIMAFLLVLLFTLLCIWLVYKIAQLIHQQTTQLQNWIWQSMKQSSYFSPVTVLLKTRDENDSHGQLVLALYFIVTTVLLVTLCAYVVHKGAVYISVNDAMFHLFRGISIRSEHVDNLMMSITLLGQKEIILPLFVVLSCWLLYTKRPRAAYHFLALGVLAAIGVFVLKHLFKSPRPWGIFQSGETFSMPSGHTTMATTFFIGLAFFVTYGYQNRNRNIIYFLALLIALFVGISRLYLGAHWFTDVLAAWLLGSATIMLVAISYQRKYELPIKRFKTLLVCLVALIIGLTTYKQLYFNKMQISYQQVSWPTETVSMSEWWKKNAAVPAYRVSLFGFPSQFINVEWVGDIDKIRDTLAKQGWTKPPARDWVSTLHRVADIKSTEYLPMVSPQYLDKRPALIMTRHSDNSNGLLVIRLWDSNRKMKDTNKTLWVGIVRSVQRPYSWLFKTHVIHSEADPRLIFPNNIQANDWEWKTLILNIKTRKNKIMQQKMVLVRATNSQAKK